MFRSVRIAPLVLAASLVTMSQSAAQTPPPPAGAPPAAQPAPLTAPDTPTLAGSRVFEMRTYYANPGKIEELQKRFRDHTVALFKKHGMENVGYWVAWDKPDVLVYILAHKSREPADASWKAFQGDPDWQAARKESEANGPLVAKVDRAWLSATDYSAIR